MTLLFLGGGTSSAVLAAITNSQDRVKEVVVDEERRDAAVATLTAMKALAKERNKTRKGVFKQLEKAFSEHGAPTDAVDALWEEYYQQVREFNDAAVDLRFELKDQITRDEWHQIFDEGSSAQGSSCTTPGVMSDIAGSCTPSGVALARQPQHEDVH
jgi:hypothetical protein